jgi:hypoxanthine phosphoribosyltransferase
MTMLPENVKKVFNRATCLHSRAEVDAALDDMAFHMSEKLSDKNPILLVVMTGGVITAGQLATRLDFPLQMDYVHATRYNSGLTGSEIKWRAEPKLDLKDRYVVIVDDILDEGLTLSSIIDYCQSKEVRGIYTAVLVDKNHPRKPGGLDKADFTGLFIEDRYVFGYGLDYKEYLRNASGIYAVHPDDQK